MEEGGTVPEAFAGLRELNVPEPCNGAAVLWISDRAADKGAALMCLLLMNPFFGAIIWSIKRQKMKLFCLGNDKPFISY